MRKFIDLSVSLEEGISSDPEFMLPKISYHNHKDTAEEIIQFFPGLKKEDLPNKEGWAMETLTMSSHNGTHMDAPYHYHSTMDNGKRAITIDEVPLEWCYNKGIKLDFRSYKYGHVISVDEIKNNDSIITSIVEFIAINKSMLYAYLCWLLVQFQIFPFLYL